MPTARNDDISRAIEPLDGGAAQPTSASGAGYAHGHPALARMHPQSGRAKVIGRNVVVAMILVAGFAGGAWAPAGSQPNRQPSSARSPNSATSPQTPGAAGVRRRNVIRRPALVVLWGDSLAWQAQDSFAFAVGQSLGAEVEAHTFPGTATCDWLADMGRTVGARWVTAAVLEFSGNALTPCMRDAEGIPLSGEPYQSKYLADTRRALAILSKTGASVYVVGAPVHRDEGAQSAGSELRAMYRSLAARTHATYIEAGASVLEHGNYTDTLPCLPIEAPDQGCRGGRIAVRASDGLHFCPLVLTTASGLACWCPVWSSGALRFGIAMATPVIAGLRSRESR